MSANHQNVTPERISELSENIRTKLSKSLKEIDAINMQVHLLSVNAQIEAARAGAAGRSFAVVAMSMGELSGRTQKVADGLASEVQRDIGEMTQISRQLSTDVRGGRLSDLALNNIDLIDRNLYERSCDVRWWATDPSLTEACEAPDDDERARHASKRMGVILDAYTVYFDLVLCTVDGKIIANGRPSEFRSEGSRVAQSEWFKSALSTRSGDEFGFETAHASPLVNGQRILAYSCAVREGSESRGQVVGVLGILFRWDSLAQTVVRNTPLPEDERPNTRAMIVDKDGFVLADTGEGTLRDRLKFNGMDTLFKQKKGFMVNEQAGSRSVIAHALSPGFETYSTGWHSVIVQQLR
jgi:hypothetical protein